MPNTSPFVPFLALAVAATVGCHPAAAADPPKPADLLAEYKALGLPLPPAKARLVRYQSDGGYVSNGKLLPKEYSLAFELQPAAKGEGPLLLQGTREWRADSDLKVVEGKPTAAAAGGVELDPDDALALAAQCHARGWDDLTKALLKHSQPDEGAATPTERLVALAWRYWVGRLSHPTADRTPAAKRMKELMKREPKLDTEEHRALLRSLELALAPGQGKPGSVEALIDALVDLRPEKDGGYEPGEAYWRVAETGFAAVPALITALEDDRLTRWLVPVLNARPSHMLVRDVAAQLLQMLSGGELDGATEEAAKAWWAKAEKVGEEKYLLEHVLPPAAKEWHRSWINDHLVRLIAARYPKRLPDVYRTVLDRRPEVYIYALPVAVAKSSLPAKEKADLFAAAGGHKDLVHRLWALQQLKGLDGKRFDALLLATIEGLPKDVTEAYWSCPEAQFAPLAAASDDPKVWAALEKAVGRASFGLRSAMLDNLAGRDVQGRRADRLRLLSAHLEDTGVLDEKEDKRFGGPGAGFPYNRITAGDAAALDLARMVGVEVPWKLDLTTPEWAALRETVRKAVKAELDKAK